MSVVIKNKTIIFFDGDGTLWYPRRTKWTKKPNWIYREGQKPKDYLKHLVLTPSIGGVLKKLKQRGILLVALSIHPHKRIEADFHMNNKVKHLKLDALFDFIYTARPYPWGKGKVIASVLKKKKIPKSRALLVGDSYVYDYLSAKKVGVECLLLRTAYLTVPPEEKSIKTIKNLKELL